MADSEEVVVPAPRDVRATLDRPEAPGDACVVACPPHPQMGGSRTDARLNAVSDAVAPDIACLRIDYGPWDEGDGERRDAAAALAWARDRFDTVALFGYSFGAGVALLTAADETDRMAAVAALAPPARLGPSLDVVDALATVACPMHIVVGERDQTVEWQPVVDRARELDDRLEVAVTTIRGDHFFVGQTGNIADVIGPFLSNALDT